MELYKRYLTEAVTNDKALAKQLEKGFGVKIKKMKVRKIVEFELKDPLDEEEMSNWDTIDGITKFLEKKLGSNKNNK